MKITEQEFQSGEFVKSYDFVKSTLVEWNFKNEHVEELLSLLEEEITNLEKYSGASNIQVILEEHENTIYLTVVDDGIPFNPYFLKEDEEPKFSEHGGMGIVLLKQKADYYSYEFKENKNYNYLRKRMI